MVTPVLWTDLSLDLDPRRPAPLYRQLFDKIAASIRSGRLPDGARLPPTRELAGLLGLNRTTVAAAYETLEKDGLLRAHVGRGSFVCAPAGAAVFGWEPRFRSPLPNPVPQPLWPADAEVINFSSARPDPALLPLDALRRAADQELAAHGDAILQLGAAEGYPPLRELLLAQMRQAGIAGPDDDLVVTSGLQQALDLIAKILAGPAGAVLMEDPVYPGARDLFLAAGAEVRGLPVGPAGILLPDLEQELARRPGALLLVTPNFQNPTGATLPLEARREILRLAARFETAVIENDVYAGLRYRGQELPTLKSLDRDGRVLYLRSFAKTAFPGLRVGWCVAPRPVTRRLIAAKQLSDLHTDQLSQAVLCRLSRDGTLAAHLSRIVGLGAARLEAAVAACGAQMPDGVRFHPPEGGMHLWLELPAPLEAAELAGRARADKVVFVPGRFFGVQRSHSGALRLSFAGLEPEKIRRGVATLARLIRAHQPAAAGLEPGGVPALV